MKIQGNKRIYPSAITFREVQESDIPVLAKLSDKKDLPPAFWHDRILGYLRKEFNPHKALSKRVIFVAHLHDVPVGFIAGHITLRSDYPGHIQWIVVSREHQRTGIGTELLHILVDWFTNQNVFKVRADVNLEYIGARNFFIAHQAELQNNHWLCWEDIKALLPEG